MGKNHRHSRFILNCVRGYKIPLLQIPSQKYLETKSIRDNQKINRISKTIEELISKGAVVESKRIKGQYLSSYFLVKEPDGTDRFILNLKKFNRFVKKERFKLEDIRTVTKLLNEGDFMASIDMKDAYFAIPVEASSQRYLMFKFQSKYYRFVCLPFGLCTCPYIFTKIIKQITYKLRSAGYISVVYLDDWLCIGRSRNEYQENVQLTLELLQSLGFVINFEKSSLIPSNLCKFLGVIIDSINSTLTLTDIKKYKLLKILEQFYKKDECRILDFARLLGRLVAACIAVQYGWLYTKVMEREKLLALKMASGSYLGRMKISHRIKSDIKWWHDNIVDSEKSFKTKEFDIVIFTDASDTGWGATDGSKKVFGFWDNNMIDRHINYKELSAVKLALEKLVGEVRNKRILLRIDNVSAIAHVNRMGSVRYDYYNKLARKIWQWTERNSNWLIASYIPSKDNVIADRLSRIINPDAEWELSSEVFENIVVKFGVPEVELFASKLNKKCKKYVFRFPDSLAWQVDAFTFSWKRIFFYAFPPSNLISRTLEKIRAEQAEGILIVPNWKNQPWYPILLQLKNTESIVFESNRNLLTSLCRRKVRHRVSQVGLIATVVSGRRSS